MTHEEEDRKGEERDIMTKYTEIDDVQREILKRREDDPPAAPKLC